MTSKTIDAPARSWFERTIPITMAHVEVLAYIAIVVLSIIAHLWHLDAMAMHHDESIHAWSSWNFYTGRGGFQCYGGDTFATYCYDPVYHGPSLYILTLISFFLFGDGDAQARLPMAMAGIGMVASTWMLRPLIGRRGAFVAALLMGFSPSLLYFTRFARHDGLMVLWEFWIVVGMFRYMQSGKSIFLYLVSVGLALAIGTHELYYILLFICGIFFLVRLLSEISIIDRFLGIVLLVVLGICVALVIINPPLPIGKGLYLGEKAMLVATTVLLAWFSQRVWHRHPMLLTRLRDLWHNQRTTLWITIALFILIYLVQYTTFFSYPKGALHGLYAGLAYWLGSQHEYARGDQPWYYYLMQLPLYEPLGVLSGIGAFIYLYIRKTTHIIAKATPVANTTDTTNADTSVPSDTDADVNTTDTTSTELHAIAITQHELDVLQNTAAITIFPLLLLFWFLSATVIFSWAGEKMPWLLVHMSLPGNLLAAWAIGKLLDVITPPRTTTSMGNITDIASTDDIGDITDANGKTPKQPANFTTLLLIPPAVFLLLVTLSVALWRMHLPGDNQEAQSHLVQGLVPLIIAGVIIYSLLTIAQRVGAHVVLSLMALTMTAILGGYMLHSTWNAVYNHPDAPIELLVYTQSSPDIPRYVKDIETLSINVTRNYRTKDDVTGGFSMPIVIDNGDKQGGGSLAWPLQWYFRHQKNIIWKNADSFSNPTAATFEVIMPSGEKGLAPVLMFYKSHITPELRTFLTEHYVRPYGSGGALNWWFPEGNKCAPEGPGYKRFYFNTWSSTARLEKDCGSNLSGTMAEPWAPLLWAFKGENWETLKAFVLYRKLPESLTPGSRDMEVWVRNDIIGGVPESLATTNADSWALRLVAQQAIGEGNLVEPTGITVDAAGKVYVADTRNHRIAIFAADGTLEQTIGTYGKGNGQFDEPRGIAVDNDGFIYVADTWNARIVKLSPQGEWVTTWGNGAQDIGKQHMATITGSTRESNDAAPLGFFGPRSVVIGRNNHVYIADTGNRRIVVTDTEGNYLYQWGVAGSAPGEFNEPTSIARDKSGNIYVADSWNGRVQVFLLESNGNVAPTPVSTWAVNGWDADTYLDPAIAVNPTNGDVYVSVPSKQYVLAATMRGETLLRWGGAGGSLAALNHPSCIATDAAGQVYVVDRASSRVLRFVLPEVRPLNTVAE